MSTRPAVPKRKPVDTSGMEAIAAPFRQMGKDVVSGTKTLVEQGKTAVGKVQEGYRRVRRHLTGK